MHHVNDGNFIVLKRQQPGSEKKLLVLVNLDSENRITAAWDPASTGLGPAVFYDLLTGNNINVTESNGLNKLSLEPGQPVDFKKLDREMDHIYSLDLFNSVTYDLVLNEAGEMELSRYDRTLPGGGMLLEFSRQRGGEVIRRVSGRLVKVGQ